MRELLNRNTKPGQHRWLCVRVPSHPETYEAIGIDLPAFAQAGVDMVNASSHYYRGTYSPTDVYGEPAEPPYDVFKRLGDPAWLAQQPQHYFIGLGQGHPKKSGRPFQDAVNPGIPVTQTFRNRSPTPTPSASASPKTSGLGMFLPLCSKQGRTKSPSPLWKERRPRSTYLDLAISEDENATFTVCGPPISAP